MAVSAHGFRLGLPPMPRPRIGRSRFTLLADQVRLMFDAQDRYNDQVMCGEHDAVREHELLQAYVNQRHAVERVVG